METHVAVAMASGFSSAGLSGGRWYLPDAERPDAAR
jgi:hypothetical protein